MVNEIINTCITKLETTLGINCSIMPNPNEALPIDAFLRINGVEFVCVSRDYLKASNFLLLMDLCHKISTQYNRPVILAVRTTSHLFMERANATGVNVIDTAGNCEITYPPLFIRVIGLRNLIENRSSLVGLHSSGLSVLLALLADPELASKPFRMIQNITGASLGTINGVFELLSAKAFIFNVNGKRQLTNLNSLLSIFVDSYNESVKKRLYMATMSFLPGIKENWDSIQLPNGMEWGGDCGAFKMNHYLFPDSFEIYSEISPRALLYNKIAVPSNNGDIKIFKKIWRDDNPRAHAIIIFSDLMSKADSRSIETAQIILDHELSYLKK